MKTRILRSRGRFLLVEDKPKNADGKHVELACLDNHADSNCWVMVDVRLSRYRVPGPYATSLSADDFHAMMLPKHAADAEFMKSMLREYREDPDGAIHWCTFEGIVRGEVRVQGYRPPEFFSLDHPVYLSRAAGLVELERAEAFWELFDGNPADARLPNPHRQVGISEMWSLLWSRNRPCVSADRQDDPPAAAPRG